MTGSGVTIDGDSSATINSAISASVNQEWSVDASEVLAISGVISGSGDLTKSGTGTLVLSGANTYSGDTSIADGVLKLGTDNSLPVQTTLIFGGSTTDGTLELDGYDQQVGTLEIAGGATAADQLIGNSSASSDAILTINDLSGSAGSFGGTISDKITGSGTRTTSVVLASGSLALTGTNSYSGGTTVSSGYSQWASSAIAWSSQYSGGPWSAAQATGAPNVFGYGDNASSWIASPINGSTPEYITLGYSTPVHASGVTIRENWGNGFVTMVEVRNASSGSFETVWSGTDPSLPGSVVNFNVAFEERAYLVDAVRVTTNINHNLGTWEEIDAVALIGAPAELLIDDDDAIGTGVLTLSGGILTASGAIANDVVIANGLTSTVRVGTSDDTLELNGDLSGAGSLKHASASGKILELGGDNSGFDGSFLQTIAGSSTVLTSATAGSSDAVWNFEEGVVASTATGGSTIEFGALLGSATLQNNGSSGTVTYEIGALNSAIEFEGTIQDGSSGGTVAITKAGSGSLTLTAANTFSGGITVSAGTLNVGTGGTTGSLGTGNIVNNGSIQFERSDTLTISSNVSGSGSISHQGSGTLVLSGTNTFSGGTTVDGGTLEFSANGLGSAGTVSIADDSVLRWGASNSTDISGRLSIGSGQELEVDTNGNNVTFASAISGTGVLIKTGSGALSLSGSNTFSGGVIIDGGTLQLSGGSDRLATSGAITVTGGVLDLGGYGQSTSGALNLQGGTIQNGTVTKSGGAINAQSGTVTATIAGSVALTKSTSGTLTLSGANSYSGGTTVQGGTLAFASSGLGTSGTISISDDAILQWASGNTEDLSSRLFIDSGANATLDTGANNVTFATTSFHFGSVTKAGSGTLILTGTFASSFGDASIDSGIIQLGTGGTSGWLNVTAITNDGSLVFNRSDIVGFDTEISGTGSVTQAGTGTLRLGATNSYSGGTNIDAGILRFEEDSLGTTGDVTFTSDATLQWWYGISSGHSEDVSARIVINNGVVATIDTNENDVTFASSIGNSGTGSLVKTGNGTLTFTAANTYTGTTTINQGVVVFEDEVVLVGSGTLTINGETNVHLLDGLAFDADGSLTINDNANVYFVGTSEISGDGWIHLADPLAEIYSRGVDSLTPATLTIDEDVTVYGEGAIAGHYSGDELVNEGTIRAEVGTLTISLSYVNNSVFAAIGAGRLARGETELHGSSSPVSGTEVLLHWEDLLPAAETYEVQLSTDNGATYSTIADLAEDNLIHLFGSLQRNTSHQMRLVASYSDGSQEIYYSDATSTLDKPDESGWYTIRVRNSEVFDEPFSEAVPGYPIPIGGVFAGSQEGAIIVALGGLADDGTVPQLDENGNFNLYEGSHESSFMRGFAPIINPFAFPNPFSFLFESPEDPLSVPARSIVDAVKQVASAIAEWTLDPTRYFDGAVDYSETDLSSNGLGEPFNHARSWTASSQWTAGQANGSGWLASSVPTIHATADGTFVSIVNDAKNITGFELSGGQYVPTSYSVDTLEHDTDNDEFIWTDSEGNELHFYDFNSGVAAARRGTFKSKIDAGGLVTEVTSWTASGAIQEIRRQDASETAVESWLYSYLGSGDENEGLLASVQLRHTDGSSGWDIVRQVAYEYYETGDAFGNLGDLKTATVKDQAGNELDTSYYRYYTDNDSEGFQHGLKYVFDPASYARLVTAYGGDLSLVSDSAASSFAQHYFEYDEFRRVTRHDIQGVGGPATGGIGTFTYEYSTNVSFSEDTNAWVYKTIETLPDGNTNTLFMNSEGVLILKDYEAVSDNVNPELEGEHWLTYREYDELGRLVLDAQPSVVIEYDIDIEGVLDVTLAEDLGPIYLTEYYASTDADDDTAGGVEGFFKSSSLQQGTEGVPVLQTTTQYFVKSDGNRTNVVLANETAYGDEAGLDERITSYEYSWFDDTVAVESVITTLPTIAAGQNGSGTANTVTKFYDIYGRPIWTRDESDYISYVEYDDLTGAVIKSITDVDTTSSADFENLPDGWSTVGDRLHLITEAEVDSLGRATRMEDPNNNVTYIVYNDVSHERRTYAGWNSGSDNIAGSIFVERTDRVRNYTEEVEFVWTDVAGLPVDITGRPTGAESLADSDAVIQAFTRIVMNDAGQAVAAREYSSLDGVTYSTTRDLASKGSHYLEKEIEYSPWGRIVRAVDPSGNRQHMFYDGRGRLAQAWSGTDAIPSTDYNDDSQLDEQDFRWWIENVREDELVGPAGTSIYLSTLYTYDNNEIGDSNLTHAVSYFGSGVGESYATNRQYDWRNRLIGTLTPNDVATIDTLDNLGNVVESQTYASSTFDGGEIIPGDLRAQSQSFYDDLGRIYETRYFEVSVDPMSGDGTAGDYLPENVWYDPRGLVTKTVVGAGAFTKFEYDGAGRLVASYLSYDSDEYAEDYEDARDVAGDTVIEQFQNWYDDNGQVIAKAMFKRLSSDAVSTGALTAGNSYILATAAWYDAIGRMTHTVDFGRQDAIAAVDTDFFDEYGDLTDINIDSVPDVVQTTAPEPNTSDDYRVTKYVYDSSLSDVGFIERQIDNAGRVAETQYDLLGRVIRTIANYDNGTVAETDTDQDSTIEYQYDEFGRLATLTAKNAKGSGNGVVNQATRYLYESTDNAQLNTAVVSPDSIDVLTQGGDGVWSFSTDNDDHVSTTYDWLDRATTVTDQREVIRTLSYDSAGRLSADTVTDLGLGGENVDGGIRRIGYSYDDLGRRETVTSYSDASGTTVVNQVRYSFDGWGNLVEEWQANDGAVNTSTSPSVQYLYDDGASLGVAAYLRLTNLIYPNGRDVVYEYGSPGSTDDVLSRISTIGDGVDAHASYQYLGASRIVSEDYEEPEVKLDYEGDNFAALDRFSRIAEQVWTDYDGSPTAIDEYHYTYDRSGNRTSRVNALESALSQIFDYDDLNQLISAERTNGDDQAWQYDGLGNWSSFDDDGDVQTRGVNAFNEITSSSGIATPDYDRAGNMIVTPKPGDIANTWDVTYDAWNRVVSVTDGTTTVEYEYDGTGRRIERVIGGVSEHFYHDGQQVIETRLPDGMSVLTPETQYVWSLRYVDTPILRDSYSAGVLQTGNRLFYLTDANHNVTAVIDVNGDIQERYDYDAFGEVTVYDDSWSNPTTVSTVANTLLFAGQNVDSATGLQYSRARWYSFSVGSFISRDPIGFDAGDANIYRRVTNNPTINVDPSGLDVYIETTSSALGKHQRIVVDARTSTGARMRLGVSFAPNQPWSRTGYVYPDMLKPPTSEVDRLKTTPAQDQAIYKWLLSLMGKSGTYDPTSVTGENCRGFSQQLMKELRDNNGDVPKDGTSFPLEDE